MPQGVTPPAQFPPTLAGLAVGIGGEIAFGLAMGMVLSFTFIAAQWAGEMMGQGVAGLLIYRSSRDGVGDVVVVLAGHGRVRARGQAGIADPEVAALLQAIGFRVTLLSARAARDDGSYGQEFDHLTLRVDLDETWLADVGFGAMGLAIGAILLAWGLGWWQGWVISTT